MKWFNIIIEQCIRKRQYAVWIKKYIQQKKNKEKPECYFSKIDRFWTIDNLWLNFVLLIYRVVHNYWDIFCQKSSLALKNPKGNFRVKNVPIIVPHPVIEEIAL